MQPAYSDYERSSSVNKSTSQRFRRWWRGVM